MERTSNRLTAAFLAGFALMVAACGNRLPPQRVAQNGIAAPQPGGDVPAGLAPSADPTASFPAAPVGGGGPGGGGFGPSQCRGITTGAPGVTATTIRVGTIVARSGPLPGQFYPMTQAISAYFGMVNDAGGVCGRKLQLIVQDDGMNPDTHLQAAKKLVEDDKVFAIVGMLTAVDKVSAAYLCRSGVLDVGGFALSYNRAQGTDCPSGKPPVYWSPLGSLHPKLIGDGQYAEIIRRERVEAGAVLYHSNLDISKDQGIAQQWAANRAYCRLVERPNDAAACDAPISRQQKTFVPDSRTYDVNPVQPDSAYDPLVQQMIGAQVDSVFTSMEVNSNIKLLRSINRNRSLWQQRVGRMPAVYFQLSAYDPKLIKEAGRLAIGAYVLIPHVPLSEPGQPEMGRYLSALRRYQPGAAATSFGVQGWAGAKLFVDALAKAGADLTRGSMRQALDSFSDYTAGGLVGALTPRERVVFSCWVLVRVADRGGIDFHRAHPPSGFFCNTLKPWR